MFLVLVSSMVLYAPVDGLTGLCPREPGDPIVLAKASTPRLPSPPNGEAMNGFGPSSPVKCDAILVGTYTYQMARP